MVGFSLHHHLQEDFRALYQGMKTKSSMSPVLDGQMIQVSLDQMLLCFELGSESAKSFCGDYSDHPERG